MTATHRRCCLGATHGQHSEACELLQHPHYGRLVCDEYHDHSHACVNYDVPCTKTVRFERTWNARKGMFTNERVLCGRQAGEHVGSAHAHGVKR